MSDCHFSVNFRKSRTCVALKAIGYLAQVHLILDLSDNYFYCNNLLRSLKDIVNLTKFTKHENKDSVVLQGMRK